jgi:hypothetical protein
MQNYFFRITLKQQLILLGHVIFITTFLISLRIYLDITNKFDSSAFLFVFVFFFLIDILPTIIVHTQYWLKNYKAILTINTGSKGLKYETPTKQLNYSFDDIESLQYYRSWGKGSGWHSFGEYRYYKIIFKDKTEIVITCLMINDIENTLEMLLRMKAERHAKVVCLIE